MTSYGVRSHTALVVGATVLCGLSLRPGITSSLAVISAALALGVAIFAARQDAMEKETPSAGPDGLLLTALAIFAVATILGLPPRAIGPTNEALDALSGVVWLALAAFLYLGGEDTSRFTRVLIVAVTVTFTAVAGTIHIAATDGAGIDVLFLHVETAEALEQGSNPYTDAVTVDDGAPNAAPGEMIEGYVYPPITGIVYALGYWTLSDPRYTSLAAWLIFLTMLGGSAVRRGDKTSLLIVLVMASLPGWPLVLRASWTEPISLALAAIAFSYWHRSIVSGVFMGMAFASKQYFIVASPQILLYRGSKWRQRLILALVVVVVTVGAALLWDFAAFWSAAVEFHVTTPPRPDGQNLVGLLAALGANWELPAFLPVGAGLVASVASGWFANTRTEWFLTLAFTLSVSFVVSSQAFPNYWFLIAGLCGISLMGMTWNLNATHGESEKRRKLHTQDASFSKPTDGRYSPSR